MHRGPGARGALGESPLDYLARDPARWPLNHVKDRTWKDRPD